MMQRLSLLHHLHERLLPRCCAVGRFVDARRMNDVLYASGLWGNSLIRNFSFTNLMNTEVSSILQVQYPRMVHLVICRHPDEQAALRNLIRIRETREP